MPVVPATWEAEAGWTPWTQELETRLGNIGRSCLKKDGEKKGINETVMEGVNWFKVHSMHVLPQWNPLDYYCILIQKIKPFKKNRML
jgi:hypothetical protein